MRTRLAAWLVAGLTAPLAAPAAAGERSPGAVLVVNTQDASVSRVDLASMKEVGRFPVGERPYGIAVSRDGKTVAVGVEGEQKVKFDLKIGRLNPESKLSGQQARLNNLGYFAGFTLKDLDQVLWAAEEFACDRLSKPVTRRPRITPAPPGGEDDETASDPGTPTGITDEPIVRKLRREHGI